MLSTIFKSKLTYIILAFYLLLVIWWIKIFISGVKDTDENYLFGLFYSFIALAGGINGLKISNKWGGFSSLVGRGIIFLSLGLLSYWFGQTVWSYYNLVLQIEAPYPSIADIGYFSAIPLYSLGMYSFARASGAKTSLRQLNGKLIAIVIPLLMLAISYYLFLQEAAPDFSDPIRTFLDYGTPLGYAITLSIAIVAYFLSHNILGGKMRNRMLFIIFALVFENITDFTFLYQFATGTYYNAGINDLMFATSFMIMSIALTAMTSYE